jgi:ribosomal protein S16
MDVLDRGAKPSDETLKLIEKVATAAAKGFEE